MAAPDLDPIRARVLDRMERSDRLVRAAILGAAVLELAMLAAAFAWIDFDDRGQRVAFVMFLLIYMIVVLGFVALGAHTSRCTDRILAVLDDRPR